MRNRSWNAIVGLYAISFPKLLYLTHLSSNQSSLILRIGSFKKHPWKLLQNCTRNIYSDNRPHILENKVNKIFEELLILSLNWILPHNYRMPPYSWDKNEVYDSQVKVVHLLNSVSWYVYWANGLNLQLFPQSQKTHDRKRCIEKLTQLSYCFSCPHCQVY